MRKLKITICFLFSLGVLCNAQNKREWIEDIDYYHKTLEQKHIDLYHTISKEQFSLEIEKLKSSLDSLTDFQIIIELMRLTQTIGGGKSDGHTSIPLWDRKLSQYPIKLFDFDGEIRVVSTLKKHKHLLGRKLYSIDGVSIDTIYKKVSELTPFTENKYSLMDRTCRYMVVSEILKSVHIIKYSAYAKFTFLDVDGSQESVILNSYDEEELISLDYATLSVTHPNIKPPENSSLKDLWFTSLNNSETVFIDFKGYPSQKKMDKFSRSVFDFINFNSSKHLIIDLRDNYGGDLFVGLVLARWLNLSDSINWKSNVYVLVNRKTYSAAMVNAIQFRQLLNAKIIGEPSGANPRGYQDMGQFSLPNSKLLVNYSKRLFRLQERNMQSIQPDVFITPKWRNYTKGIDEALNWVLEDLNK